MHSKYDYPYPYPYPFYPFATTPSLWVSLFCLDRLDTGTNLGQKKPGARYGPRLLYNGGGEGSRTPVRKPIPCSSTIIVDCLTFPPVHGNQHPCTFSSFMIRPASQSFDTVVSYMFEAWVLKCRCFKSDCCN